MSTNKLQFRVSSSLKNIIGRDLITNDFIAVFELVKNAYDAHANNVLIEFEEDKITITDDGKGMSYDDIKNKWLFVAYSAKKEGVEDKDIFEEKSYENYRNKIREKQHFAGAKGIGRFSCDRLGKELIISTRKVNAPRTEQIYIKWEDFDKDTSKDFINISVYHQTLENNIFKHGTRLEIKGLHSGVWSRDKKIELRRSLEKLINPFDEGKLKNESKGDFSIQIKDFSELPEDRKKHKPHQKVNGEVKNFIFETLKLKTTQILTTVSKDSIRTKLVDRGTLIYEISEKNDYDELDIGRFNFNVFFLNQKAKYNFTTKMGIRPVDFGSVFLFKNGFRIYPFGDVGDDSFGINRRKGQFGSRALGLRDIIGRIELSSTENLFSSRFRETSSRSEGLVQTPAYSQLIDCFKNKCLNRLEKYVIGIHNELPKDQRELNRGSEDSALLDNLESKQRIIDLVYKLIDRKDEDVKLVDYDKDFLNIFYEKNLEKASADSFDKLIVLAEKSKDERYLEQLRNARNEFYRIVKQKKDAEKRAREAELAREKAEERQRVEAAKREEAELNAAKEAHRRKEAELKRKEAELREREAKIREKEASEKQKKAERQRDLEVSKNTYLMSTRRTLSNDAESLVHNIKFSANKIYANLDLIIEELQAGEIEKNEIIKRLEIIRHWSTKTVKISELITRANFKTDSQEQSVDVISYLKQYVSLFNEIFEKNKIKFEFEGNNINYIKKLSVLDLSVVLDNFIFNAEKAKANLVKIECKNTTNKRLDVFISDNGEGLPSIFLDEPDKVFELGVTTTTGSGIGLYTVREVLNKMGATVKFIGNGSILTGATFQISFGK